MKVISSLILAMALVPGLSGQEKDHNAGEPPPAAPAAEQVDKSGSSRTVNPEKLFRYNGNGHVYFSIGACQHGYQHVGVGGGGEGFVWRGLTVGGDVGYHKFVDDVGFGLGSLHVGYHFVDRKSPKKFDPFVSFSPVGAYFASGSGAAGGFGGGVNYWFKERIGLRTEVRLHALCCDEALVMFRIGVNFR